MQKLIARKPTRSRTAALVLAIGSSLREDSGPMFRYFENSPMLSQGVLLALNAGGEINEIDRACRQVETLDGLPDVTSWHRAWSGLADLLNSQADADIAKGHRLSAAHKVRRACVYYGLCERYIRHTDDRKAKTYASMQAAFRRYVELSGAPVEWVEVSYENGKSLPALFVPAIGPGRAPTVVFIDGFDLYKELVYLRQNGDAARLRNMALLIVDTPGVGEALRLRGITTRHDTEVPLGFCFSYLASRPDVDIERVGLIGLSLGGYYAPRAAAFDKRVKACVAFGAHWVVGGRWRAEHYGAASAPSSLSAPDTQLLWVTGQKTREAALDFLDKFKLDGIAQKIEAPLLVVHSIKDHLVPFEDAERLAKAAPKGELVVTTAEFGGEGHCCMDGMQTGVDLIYDWLADKLGAAPAA
jgi:dienelactone hydrolase